MAVCVVTEAAMRLDKWLFCSRFARTRPIAAQWVSAGKIRLNGNKTSKPGQRVRVSDVLTFTKAGQVFVIEITALSEKRLNATDAKSLFCDLKPASHP